MGDFDAMNEAYIAVSCPYSAYFFLYALAFQDPIS